MFSFFKHSWNWFEYVPNNLLSKREFNIFNYPTRKGKDVVYEKCTMACICHSVNMDWMSEIIFECENVWVDLILSIYNRNVHVCVMCMCCVCIANRSWKHSSTIALRLFRAMSFDFANELIILIYMYIFIFIYARTHVLSVSRSIAVYRSVFFTLS